MARGACRLDGPPCGVLVRGDPVVPFRQGFVQAAAAPGSRHGASALEAGRSGLAGAGLFHPVPSPEDTHRPHPVPLHHTRTGAVFCRNSSMASSPIVKDPETRHMLERGPVAQLTLPPTFVQRERDSGFR